MEHEATVVLEKDYLNKPRRSDRVEPRAPPWPNRVETSNEESSARGQPRKERSEAAVEDRGNAFKKPGWFDRA